MLRRERRRRVETEPSFQLTRLLEREQDGVFYRYGPARREDQRREQAPRKNPSLVHFATTSLLRTEKIDETTRFFDETGRRPAVFG